MHQNSKFLLMNNIIHHVFRRVMFFTFFLLTSSMLALQAQDSTAVDETEETEDVTVKSKMTITASQFPDGTIELSGLLRARIEGSYQKVPHQKVSYFSVNDAFEETALGDSITGPDGIA